MTRARQAGAATKACLSAVAAVLQLKVASGRRRRGCADHAVALNRNDSVNVNVAQWNCVSGMLAGGAV
jgi:hypothetical protein